MAYFLAWPLLGAKYEHREEMEGKKKEEMEGKERRQRCPTRLGGIKQRKRNKGWEGKYI